MNRHFNKNTHRLKLKKKMKQQWNKCYYCNVTFNKNNLSLKATIDHIIPFCEVWNNTKQVACCRRCNLLKGSISEELYRDWYICVNFKYSYDWQSENKAVKVRKPINFFQKTFPNLFYRNKKNYKLVIKLYDQR